MSLEARLEALTVAVNRLSDKIETLIGADKGTPVPGAPASDAAENTGATQATTTKNTTTAAQPTPPKPSAPATGSNVIEYDAVKNAVIKLAASKGRDAAVAVLNTFGVDNAQKLKPDQYPQALEALTLAAA